MSPIEFLCEPSSDRPSDGVRATREAADEIMVGLTAAETREFMALDARNQIDEQGNPFQWPWDVSGAAKARWLALFEKHEAALRRIKRLDRTRRPPK